MAYTEKQRIASQKWYYSHREYAIKHAKRYYKQRKQSGQTREKDPIQSLITRTKVYAKKRNIEFSITKDDIKEVTHCPILGIKLTYRQFGKTLMSKGSLDRIDNSKGYVPGNVQIISWRANRLKSDTTLEEMKAFAEYYSKIICFSNPISDSTCQRKTSVYCEGSPPCDRTA